MLEAKLISLKPDSYYVWIVNCNGMAFMERICLLIDLDELDLEDDWQEKMQDFEAPMEVRYCSTVDIDPAFSLGNVYSIVIFCQSPNQSVFDVLDKFKKQVGSISAFQAIVCDDPEPLFLSQVFEWGVEQFFSSQDWPKQVFDLTRAVSDILSADKSPETIIVDLNQSILSGDQSRIVESEQRVEEFAQYDYLAAYTRGTALQAVGRFNEAIDAFESARSMNKLFRPSVSGIGENLLILGKVDEAIEIFEDLEKLNKRNVDRKASLATAYLEKGDGAKARELLKEAIKLNPKHPRIAEAKAQYLLKQGKVGEAFKLLDQLRDVGPHLAAKLNEMGIKMSQKGEGKNAIALYKKAHKVVRPELRYKISLNAALACYRLRDFKLSMKYLKRCEQEYGKKLEKVDKIKVAIKKEINQSRSA